MISIHYQWDKCPNKVTTVKHHTIRHTKLQKSKDIIAHQLVTTTIQLYNQLGVAFIGSGFDDGLSETLASERYWSFTLSALSKVFTTYLARYIGEADWAKQPYN